jgi:hypothetical protein
MRKPPGSCLIFGAVLFVVAGCGGDSDTPRTSGKPLFTFEPGPPGQAVGIRAVVVRPDGTINSAELEVALSEESASSNDQTASSLVPMASDSFEAAARTDAAPNGVRATRSALCDTQVGNSPDQIGTVDGRVCWLSYTFSGGSLSVGASLTEGVLFAKEGSYFFMSGSKDVYYPPDFSNINDTISVGCAVSPTKSHISVDYLNSMSSIGMSVDRALPIPTGLVSSISVGQSIGMTVFPIPETGEFAQAYQYDQSNVTAVNSGFPMPFSMRSALESGYLIKPVLVARRNECGDDGAANPFDSASGAAPSSDEPYENETDAFDGLAYPLLDHLGKSQGHVPGHNVVAGTNADAMDSLAPSESGQGCENCPNASLAKFVADLASRLRGTSAPEAASIGADAIGKLPNVIPDTLLLGKLLREAGGAVKFFRKLYEQQIAANNPNLFVAKGLVTVTGEVGKPMELTWTTREVAELLGRPADDVLGATLRIEGSPIIDPTKVVFETDTMTLYYTPKESTPIVVNAEVDLSTAKGSFPEAKEWKVLLKPRLITAKPGPAKHVYIAAPSSVPSGGPITLNAMVVDANGNSIDEVSTVRFEDAHGTVLAEVQTERGVASYQYVPTPNSPSIKSAKHTELSISDAPVQGVTVEGDGFSAKAEILLDNTPIEDTDYVYNITSSHQILIAAPEGTDIGFQTVQVVNPGDLASEAVSL